MKDTQFGATIVHKTKPELIGELTALRGGINILREDKEVELDGVWTGEKLKDYKLVKDY